MSAENAAETDSELPDRGFDSRTWAIAKKLVESTDPTRLVARFIQSARRKAPASPRMVRAIDVKLPEKQAHRHVGKQQSIRDKYDRADKKIPTPRASSRSIPTARASSKSIPTPRASRPSAKDVTARASSKDVTARASSRDIGEKIPAPRASRSSKETLAKDNLATESARPARAPRQEPEGGWVSFRVTWGKEHGADARRILAMVCRRGDVDGNQIGAIRIDRHHSIVDVARPVAKSFAEATLPPDPRNPRVRISEERGSSGAREQRAGNYAPRRAR